MSQLELPIDFGPVPPHEQIDQIHQKRFENTQVAIDDIYTNWVLQDYQKDDEKSGMFFEEGFELSVKAYELETGVIVTVEERERIKHYLQESWAQVEKYGFDEPLVNDNEKQIAERGENNGNN